MKKKLFYVITKEVEMIGDFEETTGNKNITVYEIIDNVPKILTMIDVSNEDNSIECIQEWLNVNGHSDETFEFIQL
jgi:hypothetical protein